MAESSQQFSQDGSPLRIFTNLGPGALVATGLQGRESLNEPYHFTVDLMAPRESEIPFQRLMGSEVRLELDGPGKDIRHFHGVIAEFSSLGHELDLARYRAVLAPALCRLAFTRRSRVFQDLAPAEILARALAPVGGALFRLDTSRRKRDFRVQFQETDLDFFRRICSEEGYSFFWEHTKTAATLVVADRTSVAKSIGPVSFAPAGRLVATGPHLREWTLTQRLSVNAVTVQGCHFQLFDRQIDGHAESRVGTTPGSEALAPLGSLEPSEENQWSEVHFLDQVTSSGELRDNGLADAFDLQEGRARLAAEAAVAGSIRAGGSGICPELQPGCAFQFADHSAQDGLWLSISLEHQVTVDGRYWLGEKPVLKCLQVLAAAPLSLEQRPWPPLPKPRVQGFVGAVVIGPEGHQTFVDRYGRVQLRYLWERGEALAKTSSCWVRVSQSWAGRGYGAFFWPRIGNEVIVAFEEGDPDRPLVVGSVYNSRNNPPLTLPGNSLAQGFRTSQGKGDSIGPSHTLVLADGGTDPVVLVQASTAVVMHQEHMRQTSTPNTVHEMLG
jgi:type VI secretion system secreted protein VgrG